MNDCITNEAHVAAITPCRFNSEGKYDGVLTPIKDNPSERYYNEAVRKTLERACEEMGYICDGSSMYTVLVDKINVADYDDMAEDGEKRYNVIRVSLEEDYSGTVTKTKLRVQDLDNDYDTLAHKDKVANSAFISLDESLRNYIKYCSICKKTLAKICAENDDENSASESEPQKENVIEKYVFTID